MPVVPGFIANVTAKAKNKPWIIIGKGPSFSKIGQFDLKQYYSVALNHAVNKVVGVDYVHVADVDVLDKIEETLLLKCATLVTPYFLHNENSPDPNLCVDRILEDKSKPHHTLFKYLLDCGRINAYVSGLSKHLGRRLSLGRSIYVRYFSSVAVFNLLCACGVKDITLIGVDGGTAYAPQFSDLTALTNGRTSFDVQFEEIGISARRNGVKLTRIFCDD